jgi:hypothetical protein
MTKTAREVEHEAHNAVHGSNIARGSTVAKRSSDPVAPHPGMSSRVAHEGNVATLTGFTETEFRRTPNDMESTAPPKQLFGTPCRVHPGMKQTGFVDVGSAVLDEGLKHAGPDHPLRLGK